MERTIFGDASGDCLAKVVDLPEVGKVGSLSCWEHIQPLLKYYTLSQGEEVHYAAWPCLDAYQEGSPGFYSMSVQGCFVSAQSYAIVSSSFIADSEPVELTDLSQESQTFVLHTTCVLSEKGVEAMKTAGAPLMGSSQPGSSAIIGPDGRLLSKPNSPDETLIIADLDLSLITKTRTFADAAGHCMFSPLSALSFRLFCHLPSVSSRLQLTIADSRPDLMWLGVNDQKKMAVRHETIDS
jgi:predicted amidohydrolase